MRSPVVSQCIKRLVGPPPDSDQTPFPIIVRTVPWTTSVVPAGCYRSSFVKMTALPSLSSVSLMRGNGVQSFKVTLLRP